jgi:hypothetical protein
LTTKHRLVAVALLALVLCLALPLAANAATPTSPVVSAAGAVGTSVNGGVVITTFSARASRPPDPGTMSQPAQGFLLATSRSGPTFTVSVQHIMAPSPTEVHLGGVITKASDPSLVGKSAHCVAVDSGRSGDQFSIAISSTSDCACAPATPVLCGDLCAKGASMGT